MGIAESLISQLDDVLKEWQELVTRSEWDDASDQPESDLVRLITRARAAIHRVGGMPSVYVDQCEEIVKTGLAASFQAKQLVGVVDSLKADAKAGYLESQRELIHGELFADFLEMAAHLLDEGYKDAAAVIGGSSLEAHLRQLCVKAGIDTDSTRTGGGTGPKKTDLLNSELAKAKVYSVLDQKNVTAWLDLRNKAAHGHYGQYEALQVKLMISGIRDFLTRIMA